MAQNLYVVIGIVVVGLLLFGMYWSQNPASISGCNKENMNILCSEVQVCVDYFKNQGAPQEWLNKQLFECDNGACFITPSECGSEFVQI